MAGDSDGKEYELKENEVHNPGYKILQRVIAEKLWISDPEKRVSELGDRVPDRERILEIAREEIPSEVAENRPGVFERSATELASIAQSGVGEFVNWAQAKEIIPPEAVRLADRVTRPSDIKVVKGEGESLNLDLRWDNGKFRDEGGGQSPDVFITSDIIDNRIEYYSRIAGELGINLSDDQVLRAATIAIASHEWAHSLERALETQYLQIIRQSDAYDDKTDYWNTQRLAQNIIFYRIKDISMVALPNMQESNSAVIHSERFATGFEFLATQFALEKAGVAASDTQKFMERLRHGRQESLRELRAFRNQAQMEDIDLEVMASDVRIILRDGQINKSWIPLLWREAGYFAPYSETELRVALKSSVKDLQNAETVKQDLIDFHASKMPTSMAIPT